MSLNMKKIIETDIDMFIKLVNLGIIDKETGYNAIIENKEEYAKLFIEDTDSVKRERVLK